MNMRCLFSAAALVLLASCQSVSHSNPPATAAKVDLDRYIGRWHEVARFPTPFQRANEAAIAEYGKSSDGSVSVHNTAVRADGTTRDIRGSPEVLNPGTNTKLAVRFDKWYTALVPVPAQGNYWILYVDRDYQRAIVGTADRKYLWILSRTPQVPEGEMKRLIAMAKSQGFETERLIRSAQHKPQKQ